mgnify:CR=1 FL=1
MLNAETADTSIPVTDVEFSKYGDFRECWTERLESYDEEIELTWYNPGDPLLIHTEPGADGRAYGVYTVLVPMAGARLTRNDVEAFGSPWPNERDGRPFSNCGLAFSEGWKESARRQPAQLSQLSSGRWRSFERLRPAGRQPERQPAIRRRRLSAS